MPRKRKEVCRKSILTKNGRTVIRVFVREAPKKGGKDYFTELLDSNAEPVVGVSTQEHRASNSSFLEDEVIDRVIARTIEKYEAKEINLREGVDYSKAFSKINTSEFYSLLCPSDWEPNKQKSTISYFTKYLIPVIQTILDAPISTDETLWNAQEAVVDIVKGNQNARKKLASSKNREDFSEQSLAIEKARLDASAQITANQRINVLNFIYMASRPLLAEYNLPPIQVPRLIPDKYIPIEQCKVLPRDFLLKLTAIFASEIKANPLACGAIILLVSMLRPSEACAPKIGQVLDCGSFGAYFVRTKVDSELVEVVPILKSDAADRVIIIPQYGMHAIHLRKLFLTQRGLTEEEINNAYVTSRADTPYEPISPRELGYYVKKQMGRLGYDERFWRNISLLMAAEPDIDERGSVLADPSAYSFRRSGCSYLMNCAAAPRLPGEGPSLTVLVDLLMGHQLAPKDQRWKKWLKRPDNWALVAQMLETIIFDPEHSAHPAFAQPSTQLFPKEICHAVQKLYIPEGEGRRHTITIQAHSTDDIVVRISPRGKDIMHTQFLLPSESSTMPIIQEELDPTYYIKVIDDIEKFKEKGGL